MKQKKNILALSVATALMGASYCHAEQASGFTITPMVGYYIPDEDLNLEDYPIGGLALGYKTHSPWAFELNYLTGTADAENSDIEVDLDQYYLTGLYHFNDSSFQPYMLLGAGMQEYSTGSPTWKDSIVVAGGGFNIHLGRTFRIRPDVRLINNLDEERTSYAVMLGFQLFLGGSDPKPKEPVVVDSDQDGIPDEMDNCPNTMAGEAVDSSGCKLIVDIDNDGVPDDVDQCLDSAPGTKVDAQGCYIVLTETKQVEMRVEFETGSTVIKPSSYSEIENVVNFMREYPLTDVVLEGHTDDSGSATFNQKLSLKRAQAVADLMINQYQIAADRVEAVGFGEARPLYPNNSADNRAKNRRVTAKVSAKVKTIQQ